MAGTRGDSTAPMHSGEDADDFVAIQELPEKRVPVLARGRESGRRVEKTRSTPVDEAGPVRGAHRVEAPMHARLNHRCRHCHFRNLKTRAAAPCPPGGAPTHRTSTGRAASPKHLAGPGLALRVV